MNNVATTTRMLSLSIALEPPPSNASPVSGQQKRIERWSLRDGLPCLWQVVAAGVLRDEGYSGDVDLAAEAIRLTRQLLAKINHEELAGLLALMLCTTRGTQHGPAPTVGSAPRRAGPQPVGHPGSGPTEDLHPGTGGGMAEQLGGTAAASEQLPPANL